MSTIEYNELTILHTLRAVLYKIKNDIAASIPSSYAGICHQISYNLHAMFTPHIAEHYRVCTRTLLKTYWREWPEFSGNIDFPVPAAHMRPVSAYHDLRLWRGTYGQSRYRLLLFLIDCVEIHLESLKWPTLHPITCHLVT